jgi:ADP-ribose pyrophosphatase YjhB (NUDIX family)
LLELPGEMVEPDEDVVEAAAQKLVEEMGL